MNPHLGQAPAPPPGSAEERSFPVPCDPGRLDISVQVLLGLVVDRRLVVLPPLLVQPEPGAPPLLVVVLDLHPGDGAHTREAVDHHPYERTVAQADHVRDIDALQQLPRLLSGQDRRLALLGAVAGSAHVLRRVLRKNFTLDEPVEEPPDGRQVLVNGLGGAAVSLDVGRHSERLDALEVEPSLLAPGEEEADGPHVCVARMFVPNGGGEEFEEALGGAGPLAGNDRRREVLEGNIARPVLGYQQLNSAHAVLYNIRRLCYITILEYYSPVRVEEK